MYILRNINGISINKLCRHVLIITKMPTYLVSKAKFFCKV